MCGRYSLAPEESTEILEIVRQVQERIKVGEIFPTNPVPVMMETSGSLVPEVMTWGYPRFQESKGRAIINARSETALDRPMFRKSVWNGDVCSRQPAFSSGEQTAAVKNSNIVSISRERIEHST